MTYNEITTYITQLVNNGFTPDKHSFGVIKRYNKEVKNSNNDLQYIVEVSIDPNIYEVFINWVDIPMRIVIDYRGKEEPTISDILSKIQLIYDKLNFVSIVSNSCDAGYTM